MIGFAFNGFSLSVEATHDAKTVRTGGGDDRNFTLRYIDNVTAMFRLDLKGLIFLQTDGFEQFAIGVNLCVGNFSHGAGKQEN